MWWKLIAYKLGIDQALRDGGYEGFKSELGKMARTLGVTIDPQITMDVHMIFRIPCSINSKSGLVKMRCDDLESFDPLNDFCLLGEKEVKVKMKVPSQTNFKLKMSIFQIKRKDLKTAPFRRCVPNL